MDIIKNQVTSGSVNAHLTPGPCIYFNAFIHVYSPRAGADNSLGRNVDVNRKPLSLCPFVGSFLFFLFYFFKYDFKHIEMILYMYIATGQGQTTIGDYILMSTQIPYHFVHLLPV